MTKKKFTAREREIIEQSKKEIVNEHPFYLKPQTKKQSLKLRKHLANIGLYPYKVTD